jgi:hypothetical protein
MKKDFSTTESKKIVKKLGAKLSKGGLEQFRKGLGVELEHGTDATKKGINANETNDDPKETGKIALAHIAEYPKYYDGLEKMEQKEEKKSNLKAIIKKQIK